MKKYILGLLLVFLMLASLFTGCSADTGTNEETNSETVSNSSTATTADTTDTTAESEENHGSGKVITIGFSNPAPEQHPQNVAFKWFADELLARSNGNIQVTVYPNGTMGSIMDTFQMCVDGTLEMTAGSLSTLSNYDKSLVFVDLPYYWTSVDAMIAVMDEYGDEVVKGLTDLGVVSLGFGDNDYCSLMSRSPINTIDDCQGLNIRCQENDIHIAWAEAIGGNSVIVSSTETWTSLQTGIIDVHDMGAIISKSGSYYDVTPYYTVTEHGVRVEYFFANEAWWNGLDEADRSLISEVFEEMKAKMNELCATERETAIQEMADEHGVTVIELSEAELDRFKEAGQSIWENFYDRINYDLVMGDMRTYMENWEAENAS